MVLTKRRLMAGLAGLVLLAAVDRTQVARAQDGDPAALRVQDFYDALLDAMRHANEIKMLGRFDRLQPVMMEVFDVPTMTRMAVGPDYAKFSPSEQAGLREAFGKLLVATFASTFDDFKGERFTVDADVLAQGSDKLVKTLFHPIGAPVEINFLMRGKGGSWKVVDIYLNGTISQLATWRSQYGALVSTAGYTGMIDAVQKQTDKFMSSF